MSEASGTQYGGFWIRFLALLVDSAILFVVSVALFVGATMGLGAEALTPVAFAVWLIWFFYFPVMHASARQGTFGKALLGLKVARVDGGRISILRSLGRELAKILSSAVFMVGYIMAGFTGRKQALHDLVASTYVIREGASHLVPALAVAVAGYALPVVLVPMLIGGAMMSMMTGMMMAAVMSQPAPTQQAARPPAPPKAAPTPQAPAPAQTAEAPAPTAAPAPAETAQVPAPAQAAPSSMVVVAAPAPVVAKQAAVVVAKQAAVVTATPAPAAEPKPAEAAQPKAAPVRVAQTAKPQAVPAFEPKAAAGPKFNDLMTAVMYRDAEGVSELLRFGKWADKPDGRGATPLMTAVELGDVRTAEALLRGGANPNLAMPVAEQRRDGDMMSLLKRYGSR
jgi:uncharacterized RDD family membrane protein YckC